MNIATLFIELMSFPFIRFVLARCVSGLLHGTEEMVISGSLPCSHLLLHLYILIPSLSPCKNLQLLLLQNTTESQSVSVNHLREITMVSRPNLEGQGVFNGREEGVAAKIL